MTLRGITKYNTGGAMPDLGVPPGRRRIFVPGQVEDDRSVRLGGAGIARNVDLLSRVRAAEPDAFIIYKPHPDVDAGHRKGAVADADALGLADRVVRGVSTASLIAEVDEVHTLTSLAGFEALLRGRRVVVYGQPFYAGWGLTEDHAPVAFRTRRLSLEALVAGALILYPRYFDPVTRLPCGPETIIERLADPKCWRSGPLVRLRRLQGAIGRRLRAPPLPTGAGLR
jgi:capsular polysaccharide export protein